MLWDGNDIHITLIYCKSWRNRTNWDRLNPEELWQHLQDASRDLPAKLPEKKLCTSACRAKAALNAKDGVNKCWFNLINWSRKSIYDIYFWQHPHFTAFLQKCLKLNSTVALQGGFLKHLGDVVTVLLDLVCLSLFCFFMSFQTDWMMMRSDLCVEHWLLSDSLYKQKSHWITINGKMNVWKCKLSI